MSKIKGKETKEADIDLAYDGGKIKSKCYGSLKSAKKILVFCHGFPGTNRLDELANILNKKSIAVVEINYRGDKESGGKFSFIGSIADIMTVTDYLRYHYSETTLYAVGYSMGGFYVANLIEFRPDIFDRVILLNPVVDTKALFSDKVLMSELWDYAKNILSLADPDLYNQEVKIINNKLNPVGFANRLKTPIDIVQSTHDEVLSPKTAKNFFSSLNCGGKFLEIPNAKHDLLGNEKQLIEAIIE